jgi:hypothetical protein
VRRELLARAAEDGVIVPGLASRSLSD